MDAGDSQEYQCYYQLYDLDSNLYYIGRNVRLPGFRKLQKLENCWYY